jgi:uncharacterized protein (DUF1697 family)
MVSLKYTPQDGPANRRWDGHFSPTVQRVRSEARKRLRQTAIVSIFLYRDSGAGREGYVVEINLGGYLPMEDLMGKSTYVALLRGINVGGRKIIKMDQLRASFEAMGLEDVKTYVQSGNAIFKATKKSEETLSREIQERILLDFGFSVSVIVVSPEEVNRTITGNPFLRKKGIDASKLHVTFLSQAPERSALKALEALPAKPDEFRHSGKAIYLYCPNGYGKTKLSNNTLERVLSVRATTRNWQTVNKLYEMSVEQTNI